MAIFSEDELAQALTKSEGGSASSSLDVAEYFLASGDREQGIKYCLLAAEQGSSAAAGGLAALYAEDGVNDEAVRWLRIACAAGNKVACAHLSIAYLGGRLGLERDMEKSNSYARLADPAIGD